MCEMLTGWHPFYTPNVDDAQSVQAWLELVHTFGRKHTPGLESFLGVKSLYLSCLRIRLAGENHCAEASG